MENIDWLLCDEDKNAPEEELDRPYAFYKRIYTRREFEEIREKAKETKAAAFREFNAQLAQDRLLFFENIDYIMAHRELIYARKRLADSMPVLFGRGARWIGGRRISLSAVLKLWEKGDWKWECPECGTQAYLFWSFEAEGAMFCPNCKRVLSSWLIKDREISKPCKTPEHLLCETPFIRFGSSQRRVTMRTENITIPRKQFWCSPLHSFKEVSQRWKKIEAAPRETRVAQARFATARRHGSKIAEWLCEIEKNEAILAETKELMEKKRTSDVEKLLKRIEKLAAD